jgi:hypothetical protein
MPFLYRNTQPEILASRAAIFNEDFSKIGDARLFLPYKFRVDVIARAEIGERPQICLR